MVWYAAIGGWLWDILKAWGSLFAAPVKETNMLWVIIPIYLTWLFTELFQEKRETSMGNAVSNAVIVLWASVDWSRQSVNFFKEGLISGWNLAGKIFIALLVLTYGGFIVYEGVKGKYITHYLGRIRVVTYIVLMITPIIYNTVDLTFNVLLAIILFFPVFYFVIEFINRITPDTTPIRKDIEEKGSGGFGGDFGKEDMGGDLGAGSELGKNFKI